MALPTVSIILVNYNGHRHLDACLRSLQRQDYALEQVEIVLVDNGSTDGSLPFLHEHFPNVRLILNEQNVGFAPAVNQGVRAATGQYVALLNNDTYAAPDWLSKMVELAERRRHEGVVCVAARMLDWYGTLVDFDGAGMSFTGHGFQFHYRLPAERVRAREEPLLLACGGAMLVDRAVYLRLGGFDDSYFAYFEDVDFGWRLWLAGYQVWFAPEAVVYHRQHGTSGGSRMHQRYAIYERNALATIIKNYDDENLRRVLPVALMLMAKKSLLSSADAIKRADFDLFGGAKPSNNGKDPSTEVPLTTLSNMVALGDLFDDLPGLLRRRAQVQALRKRADSAILPLFRYPYALNFPTIEYTLLQEQLVQAFGIDTLFAGMRSVRVLVVSSDPIRAALAGTGIRALEIARVLSRHCQVMLMAPEEVSVDDPLIDTCVINDDEHDFVHFLNGECDVIIANGMQLARFPHLRYSDKVLVVDMYTPFVIENLAYNQAASGDDPEALHEHSLAATQIQLDVGDFFICASERQRDFWLGGLLAQGRINPATYGNDDKLRQLIDVVPFGIASTPPVHTRQVLKGVVEGIGVNDTLLLWNGGIWEWFDPLTILRALAQVRARRPGLRLFFMGAGHPHSAVVPPMPMEAQARALAQELGLLGEVVFFNDGWVPYGERASYLLEADLAVSAHFDSAETRLAFRTRLLDCMWAGLPMIVSAGDTLAELVHELELGMVVAPGDVDGWATALLELSVLPERRAHFAPAFEQARERLRWERALEPLVRFCTAPRHAADSLRQRHRLHERAQGMTHKQQRDQTAYVADLEAQIARKNEHITRLEGTVQGLENGAVMKVLRRLKR